MEYFVRIEIRTIYSFGTQSQDFAHSRTQTRFVEFTEISVQGAIAKVGEQLLEGSCYTNSLSFFHWTKEI